MRNSYYLFFILILIASCVGEPYSTGQQHSGDLTHDYPIGQSTMDSDPSLTEIEVSNEESKRFIWQKPREVIRLLGMGGSLSDKTIADIGAGPSGYFTFEFVRYVEKVIAIDIAQSAIHYMDSIRTFHLRENYQDKIETRLVPDDDPKLQPNEADIVFMSNVFTYIKNPTAYLQKIKEGMPVGGRICIIDYKMRKIPEGVFPPVSERIPLYKVEEELETAGFKHLDSFDDVLEFQYIVIAEKIE